MTPELWRLYLRLQTEIAYPDDTLAFECNETAIAEAMEFYQWLVGQSRMRAPRMLLIGPGGLNEVEAMRRVATGAFDVLTAHAREALRYDGTYRTIVADMHDMPMSSGAYDLVYASNVLEHAFAPYIALMEIRRVLSSDHGRAYFVLPSFAGGEGGKGPFHLHCLTREVWEELLRKTGFVINEARIYPPDAPVAARASEDLTPAVKQRTALLHKLREGFRRWDSQPVEKVIAVLARLGISVNELLARTKDISREFHGRTGCAHYVCFLCSVVTPPTPHDRILADLIAFKSAAARGSP